jgi:hypothetical protein
MIKINDMKKIIIFFTMALLLNFGVKGQTLSTDTFSSGNANLPAIGANFNVPINAASIGSIYTLTVYVEYDNTVLSYTGSTNAISNTTVSEQSTSIIKILIGDFPNPTAIADGKLVDLQFGYIGGDSDLTFQTSDYGTYASSYLSLGFATVLFANSDVTNGAVDGDYFAASISGGSWNTGGNWSTGVVPNSFANVTVASGTETTTGGDVSANNVTIEAGGQLTLSNTLTATGNFLIESGSGGNGSFINSGTLTVTGNTSVESYVTGGQWHGISAPVTGITATDLMIGGGSTDVYLQQHNETTNAYTYVTSPSQSLGAMEGFLVWIDGGANTYSFTGSLNSGPTTSVTKGGLGFNFVGNPWSSAIDWDAGSGWTKTNVNNATYVYNNGTWASYVGGIPAGGGSRYIAMNQGFFVEASAGGTLSMTNDVCVHNAVTFKNSDNTDQIIRLNIEDDGLIDDAVIKFADDASVGFDSNLDAHKLFSFNDAYPQIFSTANDNMAINSLPYYHRDPISLDVIGADGHNMTISVVEALDFDEVYLRDEATGDVTNLITDSYVFTYDASITDRFTILFTITDVDENNLTSSNVNVFGYNRNISVELSELNSSSISVYNLMGQEVVTTEAISTITNIPVYNSGYYIVKVTNGSYVSTQKVFIK